MAETILIAEDDEIISLLITQQIKHHYQVLCAEDGAVALKQLEENQVDLLITDIRMPRMDGFQLVQRIRERGSLIPILMLTADLSFDAKRRGFAVGTDDFLTKPFDKEELLWRIQALLRRARINNDNKIELGNIIVNLSHHTITVGVKSYNLPKKEFEILYKLLSEPGRIYTKNQLFEDIWGFDSESSEDTIKTHISRLRNKIKDIDCISIIAVRGIGYKAEVNVI